MNKIIIAFLLICFFACKKKDTNSTPTPSNTTSTTSTPNTNSLSKVEALYLNFEGAEFADSSDSRNVISIPGTANAADSTGHGTACYFDGLAYIEVREKSIFDISQKKMSICAWIKPKSTSEAYIVSKAESAGGGGPYTLDIYPGTVRSILYDPEGNPTILTGSSPIKADVWQHVALTWDGDTAKIYYNGKQEDLAPLSKLELSSGDLFIGTYKWVYPSATFVGMMDNLRFYTKCLNKSQIDSLYTHYK